ENNTVSMLTTSEILKMGKGVCQHYSNLYVAIARSLGLPVRFVGGWLFDDLTNIPHSWLEVKISDSVWWPIDPQVVSDRLPDFGYFPAAIDLDYEAEAEDP